MRIGLSGFGDLSKLPNEIAQAESDGFASMWFSGVLGVDPMTLIAVGGHASRAQKIELGTSIVQTYTSHPHLMAQRAAAVAAAVPGRFVLGLGVSHQIGIEAVLGLSYERPAVHMREYLTVLSPLLRGEPVDFEGDFFRVHAPGVRTPEPVPILIAALAPAMLKVTGELADGTITWMANRKAIETQVRPLLAKAAAGAGRPEPRIVVGLPVAVCDEAEGREAAAKGFAVYGQLPNYQRILEVGGASGPAAAAIVGDEDAVAKEITSLFEAGATELWAAIFPVGEDHSASRKRTMDLLKELAKS